MPSALGLGLALDLEIGAPCETPPTITLPLGANTQVLCYPVQTAFYVGAEGCLLSYFWEYRRVDDSTPWNDYGPGNNQGSIGLFIPCQWATDPHKIRCTVSNSNGSVSSTTVIQIIP